MQENTSTQDAIRLVSRSLEDGYRTKNKTFAVSLDWGNAYDKFTHEVSHQAIVIINMDMTFRHIIKPMHNLLVSYIEVDSNV